MRQERKQKAIPAGGEGANAPSLAELKEIRLARKATAQRVEDLKLRLFRMTEQHMDQAVSLIRRWLKK